MALEKIRAINQVLTAKIETTEGVVNPPTPLTESIPISNFELPLNPKTFKSTEATGSLYKGSSSVTRLEPRLTGTMLMRASGTPSSAPRCDPILQAGGLAGSPAAVLPAATSFAATGGSTTTVTISTTVGNGTELPATTAAGVVMIGRIALLAVNPATARRVHVKSYTVAANVATITFYETLAAATDATTTVVFPAGYLYLPTTVIPSVSLYAYEDGMLARLVGCRGKLTWNFPGTDEPGTIGVDLAGTFLDEADAAVPTIDHSNLAAEAVWRAGRAHLKGLAIGCSAFTMDLKATDTRYPDPNQTYGQDVALITEFDPGGTLTTNRVKVATQARVAGLIANEITGFSAVTDIDGTAGTRWALGIPNFKKLDRGNGNREGVREDTIPFEATTVAPVGAFQVFIF